ncbi:MAG: DNA adenine methylase [Rhodoferax sp.]|nr:DNA adenine methylase [Rhodoferax sp.]
MIKRPAFRYHGAKFRLAKWVIENMPPHAKYVESYGGAAGVLLQKERVYAEVYNDLNGDVVNFFRVIQNADQRAKLVELCQLTPYARQEFELAYEPSDEPVERARRLAIRAAMGFGSAGATKSTTGFRINTDGTYGTAMNNWARYPDCLAAIGQRMTGVLIENRPAIGIMQQHDTPDCLHFVDPPYPHSTRCRKGGAAYAHEMSEADHVELLDCVKSLRGMVMLCSYPNDLYSDALADWKLVSTNARKSSVSGSVMATECMWLNPACCKTRELKLF